ncbi:ComF family protein [Pontibacillus salicampi]|uniref:ComF family protein n=1 Tax=Pontibacillus salicampi TaxID=1449801 RepID=A0ABV6LSL5_9BACI
MKEVMAKWKYRGDYRLVDLFDSQLQKKYRECWPRGQAVIVPIPLSEERFAERGFNQAEALARCVTNKPIQALSRIHSEKQSKKSRKDRMMASNPFRVEIPINKPVILVDDIYTTGRTLEFAAQVLVEAGTPSVESFTLVRG